LGIFRLRAVFRPHCHYATGIGIGTPYTDSINGYRQPGRFLNLAAYGSGTSGIARVVAQRDSGSQLHLVHLTGPVNQRVLRIQNASGLTTFNVVKDDLASNLVTGAWSSRTSTAISA
jgi:hypothetical protein